MAKLRVHCFTVSLDGFGAGPDQSRETPLGAGGEDLHRWMVGTRTFQALSGRDGGTRGVDDDFTARGFQNIGAWILGRNMFGPVRGPWPDESWKGWWGDDPPYRTPVFVLTHHPRAPVAMKGGTTFHFVTDGIPRPGLGTSMSFMPQAWRLPIGVIVVCGCLIGIVSFGARAGFGLFLTPISTEFQWGREVFALSIAIQNLIWGVAQPFAGMLADKFGSGRVIVTGAVIYAGGVALMSYSATPLEMHLTAGVLVGLGTAFASFMIVMATMARKVSPKWRTLVMGVATASGSIGQFTMVPLGQAFLKAYGWHVALLLLAACVLLIIPLSATITGKGAPAPGMKDQSVREAFGEAFGHKSYNLLVAGFFVCGFHVAFVLVHMPAYIVDKGLPPETGATALAMVGLFNIIGSLSAGYIGGKFSKKYSLAFIYLARAVAITLFVLLPISQLTVYLFAAAMGLLWLSTVPLTSGLVAQFFGMRYMAMLFGFVFFSHQVGSFIGVWLGGKLYDSYGTYDVVWWLSVALGVAAALVHLPIREAPAARMAAAQPA